MRNREATLRKLDQIESSLTKINMAINMGNREMCYEIIEETKLQIEQCKLYIESEPISGGELNPNF
jgi:hypothetical protein